MPSCAASLMYTAGLRYVYLIKSYVTIATYDLKSVSSSPGQTDLYEQILAEHLVSLRVPIYRSQVPQYRH